MVREQKSCSWAPFTSPIRIWIDSAPGDYTLADYVTGWWYNRNLRIFANLKRITTSPDDRILVIYGAGHLSLLRHALQSSPRHELVPIETYLGDQILMYEEVCDR